MVLADVNRNYSVRTTKLLFLEGQVVGLEFAELELEIYLEIGEWKFCV